MKRPLHNYILTHRDFYLPSKEDDFDTMYNIVVREVFVLEDSSKVLFRISASGPRNLQRDVLVNYNLRDLFLGDILKEADWLPTPLNESALLNKGFYYV